MKTSVNLPRRFKASNHSSKHKPTFSEADSCMETETTPPLLKDLIEKTGTTFSRTEDSDIKTALPATTHTIPTTPNKDVPDSKETLQANQKTLSYTNYASVSETTPSSTTLQTSKEHDNSEHVIGKIIEHKRTPKDTLYQIHWYGLEANDNAHKQESNIPVHFISCYWRSNATRPSPKLQDENIVFST